MKKFIGREEEKGFFCCSKRSYAGIRKLLYAKGNISNLFLSNKYLKPLENKLLVEFLKLSLFSFFKTIVYR